MFKQKIQGFKNEYKDKIETIQKEKDSIAKKLGETIVEKEFLDGKLVSLALKDILYLFRSKERKSMIDSKLTSLKYRYYLYQA